MNNVDDHEDRLQEWGRPTKILVGGILVAVIGALGLAVAFIHPPTPAPSAAPVAPLEPPAAPASSVPSAASVPPVNQPADQRALGVALADNPQVDTVQPTDKTAMRDGYWDTRVMQFVTDYAKEHRLLVGKPMTPIDGVEPDPHVILLCTVDKRDAQRDPIPQQLRAWLGTQPADSVPAGVTVVADGIILRWA